MPTDVIPDAEASFYEVVLLFDRGMGFSLFRVQGQARFFAASHDTLIDGAAVTHYRLRGHQDLTQSSKASEVISWGDVKARWRSVELR